MHKHVELELLSNPIKQFILQTLILFAGYNVINLFVLLLCCCFLPVVQRWVKPKGYHESTVINDFV